MSAGSSLFPAIDRPPLGRRTPYVLGAGAAILVALAISFHWIVAVLGAAVVLSLSAIEWEPFLLLVVFLIPVQWRLANGFPVAAALRMLSMLGFFCGRVVSGTFSLRNLIGPVLSRRSIYVLGAAVLSIALGTLGWTDDSSRALAAFASYVGFYFLILSWVDSRQRLRKVAATLLASTVLVGGFGVFQEMAGGYTPLWRYLNPWIDGRVIEWNARVPSFLNYSNSLAGYLNLVLPFALACSVIGRWRKLGMWGLGLGSAALLFTQSRGGLVGFACVLGLAILHFVKDWRRRFLLFGGLCGGALMVYVIGAVLSPGHLGEIETNYAIGRLIVWGLSWKLFLSSPLFGVGIGNFPVAFREHLGNSVSIFIPWAVETHNLYLELLAETGLVGSLALFSLLRLGYREARRQMKSLADPLSQALAFGVLGAIVATLVHGLIDVVIVTSVEFGTLLWVLLALLIANARINARLVRGPGASPADRV